MRSSLRVLAAAAACSAGAAVCSASSSSETSSSSSSVPYANITVAAYIYDPWTPEPVVFGEHGDNFTEWDLVRLALPRFPGHLQPKVPLWGELGACEDLVDEGGPEGMEKRPEPASATGGRPSRSPPDLTRASPFPLPPPAAHTHSLAQTPPSPPRGIS
jgi:hypothetical protein